MTTTGLEWQNAERAGLELIEQNEEGRPIFKGTPEQMIHFVWLRNTYIMRQLKT